MYDELSFFHEQPSGCDAYVGGSVNLPAEVSWPCSADGEPLTHLASFPSEWFSKDFLNKEYWISIFIPYIPGEVSHYRKLRAINGQSEAVVLGYVRSDSERNEAFGKILDCGKVVISKSSDPDDDENLASKLDGVDAWLQSPILLGVKKRRISIYGGDLDIALPRNKGILSDGMGYLFLDDAFSQGLTGEVGGFFLQLG